MDDSSKNREPAEQEGKDSDVEAAVGAPRLLTHLHLSLTPALLPLPRGSRASRVLRGGAAPFQLKHKVKKKFREEVEEMESSRKPVEGFGVGRKWRIRSD